MGRSQTFLRVPARLTSEAGNHWPPGNGRSDRPHPARSRSSPKPSI